MRKPKLKVEPKRLNIFQGANNKQNELEAWIQVKANEAIKELVGDGGLLGPLALPAGGLEPLVLRPEGLPGVYPLLHKEILWFWVPLDRMEVLNNKGILLHWCNVLDINLALVNFFGILPSRDEDTRWCWGRTESVLERSGYGWR